MLPQAKFKIAKAKENKPSPLQTEITKHSDKQTQTNILNFIEKIEPKRFKVPGQQIQIDNPKEILNLETVKGQNPPTKKISQEKKKKSRLGVVKAKLNV